MRHARRVTGDSRIERRSQRARAQDQVRQISRYNLIRSNIWMHNAANLAVKVNSDGGNRSAHVRRRRGRGAKMQVYCRNEHWIGGNGIGILAGRPLPCCQVGLIGAAALNETAYYTQNTLCATCEQIVVVRSQRSVTSVSQANGIAGARW